MHRRPLHAILRLALAAITAWLLAACSTPQPPSPSPVAGPVATPPSAASARAGGRVVGRGERLLVYVPGDGDTLQGIAARFLGTPDLAWQIAEANDDIGTVLPGQPLVVPLAPPYPLGVTPAGVQAVPILCYHRVGPGLSKMTVSPSNFEAQLAWLAANRYQVIRLDDLAAFLAGRRALPKRAVVITFDDGYESMYRHAFPLLRKYGMPATLFIYTDFVGARDALDWSELAEMWRSGLIDIQAHSKTHRNLTERAAHEGDAAYRQRVETELRQPRAVIERALGTAGVKVRYFAYPYGDANLPVIEAMQRLDYELGLTVNPGGNPFYASPWLLRRVMIYGDHDLDDFKVRVNWRLPAGR